VKALFKEFKNQIFAVMFSIVMTYWAMSSFFGMPIIDILLVIILVNSILFICCIYLKKQGISGGILFVLGSIVYFMGVVGIIILSGKSSLSYLIWIVLTKPENQQLIMPFWIATILLAAYGFTTTVYYFTNISFRVPVLLLIGMIPFMLQSAKTDSEISIPFILFVILFFLLYVERTVKKASGLEKSFHVNNPWYMVSVTIFVAILLTLALTVPKPETIPKIAYFNQVLNQTIQNLAQANGQNIDVQNLSKIFNTMALKNQSVLDSSTSPLGNNILFEVKAKEPLYFRVQSWDKYMNNRWLKGNKELDKKIDVKEIKNSYNKFYVLAELLEQMKKNGLNSADSEIVNSLDGIIKKQDIRKASIYTKGVPMQSLLNPPGVCGFSLQNNSTVYINEHAECYMANGQIPNLNEIYSIDYITQSLPHSSSEYNLLKKLNRKIVESIFESEKYKVTNNNETAAVKGMSEGKLVIDSNTKATIEEAKSEMDMAYDNYTELPDNIPQRIYDLANKTTEGLTSDYDKAQAIVNFFNNSGFKYDLTPPSHPKGKDYNDFFIFESKRGICMHFASAMVILARASGIPARYVEGFVANEWDPETGNYLIREKHAHAFPEVYIAGYGWMVFEPTVGMGNDSGGFSAFFVGLFDKAGYATESIGKIIKAMPLWVKLLFIPYIIFTIFILICLFCYIRRSAWKKSVLNADSSQAVLIVFARIAYLFGKIDLKMKKHETPSDYAERVFEASGVNLLEFAQIFNKSKYGGLSPDQEAVRNAIEKYNEVRQYVRRKVGKVKACII
jgi:hypothetical protein